jgi:hypothetical protein
METAIFEALIKQGALVALLAFCGWILWRRYDRFTERTSLELTQVRGEIKRYMEEDRVKMQDIISNNTRSLDRQTNMMDRSSRIMECLIEEIKDFKEGDLYKEHKERKSQAASR